MDRLVRILLVVAIGLIAIVVGLGFLRGHEAGKNVLAGVSAAIAAIPEEPPALVAVVLGLGAYRLLKMKVLVRRLSAQETLGSVDLIVTDKTGTLTENRLALAAIRTPTAWSRTGDRLSELATLAVRAEEDAWSVATGSKPGSFSRSLFGFLSEQAVVLELDPADLLDADPVSDDRPYSRTRARTRHARRRGGRGRAGAGRAGGRPGDVLRAAGPNATPGTTLSRAAQRRASGCCCWPVAEGGEAWLPLGRARLRRPHPAGIREAMAWPSPPASSPWS
jgi:hypothetical protein